MEPTTKQILDSVIKCLKEVASILEKAEEEKVYTVIIEEPKKTISPVFVIRDEDMEEPWDIGG